MSTVQSNANRIVALDLTKGVLVICMVLYHSLNYTTEYYLAFRYFAFLPPSFIIITGFLLATAYPERQTLANWRVRGRLLARGVKLLVLFTVLNVAIQLLVRSSVLGKTPGLDTFFSDWVEIYVFGYGRMAAFEVLLPIAYFFLLAPLILALDRSDSLVLPVLTSASIGILAWLAFLGSDWPNAQLMTAGFIGFVLGRAFRSAVGTLPQYTISLVLTYAVYFMIGRIAGQSYLLQLAGAVLALALIFSICSQMNPVLLVGRSLQRLGQYSLIAYIGQIAILQILVRWTGRPEPTSFEFLAVMLATLFLTLASVELTHWARCRSQYVGAFYRAVFA